MHTETKFIFWGTPEVASDTLEILKENGYLPSLIVTAQDKPKGRKMIITPPPVKVWATKNNIPYIQPGKLENIKLPEADFSLVVAYGKIIPGNILKETRLGSFNVHYSLLPKYRGASPVESAILNGDTKTGVTIQKMRFELDSGPIVAKEEIEIRPDEKTPELRKQLTKIGAELLVRSLPEIIEGKIKEFEQNENEATFCKKIKKEDGELNLSDNAIKNYNKFRAYFSWPRTFYFQSGKRIIITDAALEGGQFVIKKVLPEGKKEINYKDFLKTNILK